jgi:NAD(P)-dependent dehydrogenase (short-subunit alcohol dehydrogenase family)
MTRRIALTGASRGIGAHLARVWDARGDEVIGIGRSAPVEGRWVRCDLAVPQDWAAVAGDVGGALDALVHVAGIWEETAFGPGYDFATRPEAEVLDILTVNLTAPILLTQALLPALRAGRGRVILTGSTSGLPNIGTPEVAYNASKAGLAAAGQAMRVGLAGQGIGVTVIHPGDVATEEVESDIAAGRYHGAGAVPLDDMAAAFDFALGLSGASVAGEITMLPLG